MRGAIRWLPIPVALCVACGPGYASVSTSAPSPTLSTNPLRALLVFTTWVPDSSVTNGPEPGYKPAMSGLTGHDIKSATSQTDATGLNWEIRIVFTPKGASLFDQLTRDNVAACPHDPNAAYHQCAQQHLPIWLDLTESDIGHWDDAAFVARISSVFDLSCLAGAPAGQVCPKFVSDPLTLQEIPGGIAEIGLGGTKRQAEQLAAAINSMSAA